MRPTMTESGPESTADDLRPVIDEELPYPPVSGKRIRSLNLALRLAALGYTHVYWYRGGREAWEMNALPETELDVQEWESPFVPWGGYMSGRAERRLTTDCVEKVLLEVVPMI